MSDFLISWDKCYGGEGLLDLVKLPYGERSPNGRAFDFPWGGMAVLEERLAQNNNIIERDGVVVAWVGDLVTEMSKEFVDALISRIGQIRNCRPNEKLSLESDEVFEKLDGAFAILVADENSVCIITDFLNLVQVYAGYGQTGQLSAVGTHADLVATLSDESFGADHVSAAEFLNFGRIAFPNTMHRNVKQLNPASLHNIKLGKNNSVEVGVFPYWHPPEELEEYDENELALELRAAFVDAVNKRCKANRIAVSMSGGLDSRLIMAAVPESVECIGLTFCDTFNREARIAKRATECYGRQWFPIIREKEYIGNILEKTVRLIGCEGWFVHSHAIGLVDEIDKHNISSMLSGMNMDTFLKAYEAADMVRVPRMWGFWPPKYVEKKFDLIDGFEDFWRENLTQSILAQLKERKQVFFNRFADTKRSSLADWMFLHPTFAGFATWPSERRLLPMKQVVLDRKLIDFCFKCPFHLKLGKRVFLKAAKELYGAGAQIPNVSDGVRPCSGHWWRLFQRAIRKFQDRTTSILEKLGKEPQEQGSWHDYQKYWRESKKLDELRKQYGTNLDRFDRVLFKKSGQDLLVRKDLHWQDGFRLLQLAVWKGLVKDYKPGK